MNATTEEALGFGFGFGICLNRRRGPPIGHLRRHKALSYEDATQWSTSESVACSLAACTIYQAMSVFHVSSFICKEI